MILTGLGVAAVAYLLIVATLFLLQRNFIYPAPAGPAATPAGFEVVRYPTADGLELAAGYRSAESGEPTIIYFHGNGADWQSSVVATDMLVPEGYGVLAAEYRGYRDNPGSPSEEGLYADARAAALFLADENVPPSQIVIIGNSIGGGPAVQLASEIEPRALVLISAFSSLPDVAAQALPWVPARWLLRDKFENAEKLTGLNIPILILHDRVDRVVPYSHGEALAAAQPQADFVSFEGAGHQLAWDPRAEAAILQWLEGLNPAEDSGGDPAER